MPMICYLFEKIFAIMETENNLFCVSSKSTWNLFLLSMQYIIIKNLAFVLNISLEFMEVTIQTINETNGHKT